jgi:predicted Zn-dependent protease with MMP-like domain
MSPLGMWLNDDDSPDDSGRDDGIGDLDERSFEDLEDTVDQLAVEGERKTDSGPRPVLTDDSPMRSEEEFEAAVRSAIDGLPVEFQRRLDDVVITVSDDGQKQHAYGLYVPGVGNDEGYRWWSFGLGRRASPKQIIIYRDTLLRDYGNDPALLRSEITQTLRDEVGHALGFDETGVRGLGL